MTEKQGVLSYRAEGEWASQNLSALSGLAPFLELMVASGVVESVWRNVSVCGEQGWTDQEVAVSLLLLNLAGGDCVEDLDHLNADKGFGKLLKWCESDGLPRRVRREMGRRWRKAKTRSVVSPSVARRWLGGFHDESQQKLHEPGKSTIWRAGEHLLGLRRTNGEFVGWVQERSRQLVATLDLDAVLVETSKSDALYCYKGYRAFQALNVWWAEQELMLHSEFRDGNVPAGYKQSRVVKEALSYLPKSVRLVRVRSDSAGYEHDFWVNTGREWAEVCFVPNAIASDSRATCGSGVAGDGIGAVELAFPDDKL